MPGRRRCSRVPFLAVSLVAAACASGPDQLDRQLLVPPAAWLAEPSDFGLDAERFEVPIHAEASVTGFWIPHANGERRTVVLLHGGDTNASAMHPWYRFLHGAGFQVAVVDARGYGRSKGTPTLRAWIQDLPELFAWLRARADVDPQRIAVYGTGLGSLGALFAARTLGCQAAVFEHLPSPRELAREALGGDSAVAELQLGFAEFGGISEDIEPEETAPRTKVPALFVATDGEPARDRRTLVRAFRGYAGPKQLWVLEDTGAAPHGLLTHAGEYETRVASFLRGALDGAPPVVATSAQRVDTARDGQQWWQIDVDLPRGTPRDPAPALEACAVLADGSVHFARGFAGEGKLRVKVPSPPIATAAVVVPNAVRDPQGGVLRVPGAAARASRALDASWPRIEQLRNDALPAAERQQLARAIEAAEQTAPFPPELEAELADVFAKVGRQLAASDDPAEQARGQQLLQRAVAAAPKRPELHVWLGPYATFGYPQQEAVDDARRALAQVPR
jgi:fermentation-respiration switch protein FrsA (DUF1100 family)